jgi:hypothetical protein
VRDDSRIACDRSATVADTFMPGFSGSSSCAGMKLAGVVLRHIHIYPNRVHIGYMEQHHFASRAGVDQRADIGFARRHDAVEWRADVLESSDGLQALDIRLRRGEQRVTGGVGAGLFIRFLLRYRLRQQHAFPALGSAGGELFVGMCRRQICFRLVDLLVELRGVDIGQHLPGAHMSADVEVPMQQVAADTGIDWRLDISAHIAGKH